MTDEFKQPTSEAFDYAEAIQDAIEEVSAKHVADGKKTMLMDPMSALIGVIGAFVAGAPEANRPDMLDKVRRLIGIAVEQSLAQGSARRVKIIEKRKPQ